MGSKPYIHVALAISLFLLASCLSSVVADVQLDLDLKPLQDHSISTSVSSFEPITLPSFLGIDSTQPVPSNSATPAPAPATAAAAAAAKPVTPAATAQPVTPAATVAPSSTGAAAPAAADKAKAKADDKVKSDKKDNSKSKKKTDAVDDALKNVENSLEDEGKPELKGIKDVAKRYHKLMAWSQSTDEALDTANRLYLQYSQLLTTVYPQFDQEKAQLFSWLMSQKQSAEQRLAAELHKVHILSSTIPDIRRVYYDTLTKKEEYIKMSRQLTAERRLQSEQPVSLGISRARLSDQQYQAYLKQLDYYIGVSAKVANQLNEELKLKESALIESKKWYSSSYTTLQKWLSSQKSQIKSRIQSSAAKLKALDHRTRAIRKVILQATKRKEQYSLLLNKMNLERQIKSSRSLLEVDPAASAAIIGMKNELARISFLIDGKGELSPPISWQRTLASDSDSLSGSRPLYTPGDFSLLRSQSQPSYFSFPGMLAPGAGNMNIPDSPALPPMNLAEFPPASTSAAVMQESLLASSSSQSLQPFTAALGKGAQFNQAGIPTFDLPDSLTALKNTNAPYQTWSIKDFMDVTKPTKLTTDLNIPKINIPGAAAAGVAGAGGKGDVKNPKSGADLMAM